jgi:WD40 repeat protein
MKTAELMKAKGFMRVEEAMKIKEVMKVKEYQAAFWAMHASIGRLGIAAALSGPWAWPAHPQIGARVQVTSDAGDKRDLIVRGDALYFDSFEGGTETVMRIDGKGAKQSFQPFGHQPFALVDVSPDGSRMLFTAGGQDRFNGPLWIVPTGGGPPRRLAVSSASTAAWSPDGRRLAYASGRALYRANADGGEPHRLANLPFDGELLKWSPDGKRLRLSLYQHSWDGRLWEVPVDGSMAKAVLPGWSRTSEEGEVPGPWTPDGSFFVFRAVRNGVNGLWAIREKRGWLDWRDRGPFQLTKGLEEVSEPALSKDGRKLFAIVGATERGDLMRYDPGSRRFHHVPGPSRPLSRTHQLLSGREAGCLHHISSDEPVENEC